MTRHAAIMLDIAVGTTRLQAVTEAIEIANRLRFPTCIVWNDTPFTVYPGTNPQKVDAELLKMIKLIQDGRTSPVLHKEPTENT